MELTIFNSDIGKTRMSITTAYISHGGGPLPLLENSIGTGGVGAEGCLFLYGVNHF